MRGNIDWLCWKPGAHKMDDITPKQYKANFSVFSSKNWVTASLNESERVWNHRFIPLAPLAVCTGQTRHCRQLLFPVPNSSDVLHLKFYALLDE